MWVASSPARSRIEVAIGATAGAGFVPSTFVVDHEAPVVEVSRHFSGFFMAEMYRRVGSTSGLNQSSPAVVSPAPAWRQSALHPDHGDMPGLSSKSLQVTDINSRSFPGRIGE
jgi:hypothetical protein